MRRSILTTAMLGFGLAVAAPAAGQSPGKASAGDPVTFAAQVVDLSCKFVQNASGPDHKMCAEVCADKGQPLGLLGSDGQVYLPVNNGMGAAGENARLKPFAEQSVQVTGRVIKKAGVNAVLIEKITKA